MQSTTTDSSLGLIRYKYKNIEYIWRRPSYWHTPHAITALSQVLSTMSAEVIASELKQFKKWLRPVGLTPPNEIWADRNFALELMTKLLPESMKERHDLPERRTKPGYTRSSGISRADVIADLTGSIGYSDTVQLLSELDIDEVHAYCWRINESSRPAEERYVEHAQQVDRERRTAGGKIGTAKGFSMMRERMEKSRKAALRRKQQAETQRQLKQQIAEQQNIQ